MIKTGIQMNDAVTAPLRNMIKSMQITISTFANLQSISQNAVDMSSIMAAQEELNKATVSTIQMEEQFRRIKAPEIEIKAPTMPVTAWQTQSGIDIFKNTGIERYNQEMKSTESVMDRIQTSQRSLGNQAQNSNIFPKEMVSDVQSINARVEALKESIARVANQDVSLSGVVQTNTQLESLRQQLNGALMTQVELTQAMQRMDISAANTAYTKLNYNIDAAEMHIRDNLIAQNSFNESIRNGGVLSGNLLGKIKSVVGAYLGVMGVKKTIGLGDEVTLTKARLNLMNDGLQTTAQLQEMIFNSAQNSRSAYIGTASAVSKLGAQAKDAFSSNTELVAFAEQINKTFAIAGTSIVGADSAMLQLTQAMAAGKLQGEELNAILDNAQPIVGNIANYLDVPVGNIKKMASEGMITATVIKNAMFAAAEETNRKFESIPKTFRQIAIFAGNQILRGFKPVFERMNVIANSAGFNTFVADVTRGIVVISKLSLSAFEGLVLISSFVSSNWGMIGPVIGGVVAALGLYNMAMLANTVITGINTGIQTAQAISIAVKTKVIIADVAATSNLTVAQWALNNSLLASPITWYIAGFIAVIAVFYLAIGAINKFAGTSISATGLVAGAVNWVAAVIYNNIATVHNVLAIFGEFVANLFVDPIGAAGRLWTGLADQALGTLHAIAKGADLVFGSSMATSVAGWRDNLNKMSISAFGEATFKIQRMEQMKPMDWAQNGYDWGGNLAKKIPTATGANDAINNLLASIQPSIASIAGDTSGIKDSLDITEEDLRYIRDIAEQEVINRFTTAEIRVEQYNTFGDIRETIDIDNVFERLGEKMDETISYSAEGVHE